MCSSSMYLPLGLSEGIICYIKRLKGETLCPELLGGPKLDGEPHAIGGLVVFHFSGAGCQKKGNHIFWGRDVTLIENIGFC